MTINAYHIPVMLDPCLEGLNIRPNGIYVDVTFGGGGHSRAIFDRIGASGHLIAFDQDADAKANLWSAPNFHFVPANFEFLKNHLRALGLPKVDGILADLGVSSHQFDAEKRGFSFRSDARLDMRMNQSAELSAYTVLNSYDESQLRYLFKVYGEIQGVNRLVNAIIAARSSRKIKTTGDLVSVIEPLAPKFKEHKYFAQVFQAIRIEVNQELQVLERFLEQSAEVLNPGGRLVVMSYHSLEDRLVKNYMKRGSMDGTITKDFFGNIQKPFDEVVRHPIVATDEECEMNSRARSAKLRIAERNKM